MHTIGTIFSVALVAVVGSAVVITIGALRTAERLQLIK